MSDQTFFVVMSQVRGMSPFPHRHSTLEEATAEAKRLAGQSTADSFHVLQALRTVEQVRVVITDLVPDIPF